MAKCVAVGRRYFSSSVLSVKATRENVIGTATGYGLDGPGIECQWVSLFPHSSRPALGLTQPPVHGVQGPFLGVKRPGFGVDHKSHLCLFLAQQSPPSGPGPGQLIREVTPNDAPQSVGLLWTSDQLVTETST